ncbi:MAG: hypothetical protein Q8Q15_03535 [bacterium]|nr:hypothetical protein [bacterium]
MLVLLVAIMALVAVGIYVDANRFDHRSKAGVSESSTRSEPTPPNVPEVTPRQRAASLAEKIKSAVQVKERHEDLIMSIPGVVGIGVGLTSDTPREPLIEVDVIRLTDEVQRMVPTRLEGIRVEVVETGEPVIGERIIE